MIEKWDDGLISDRTDHNLEVCYCIGPQVVDGVKQPLCPCEMRKLSPEGKKAIKGFEQGNGTPFVDPVRDE